MKYVIGIDEVGRGCLAGPVTVTAFLLPVNLRFSDLRDSKKLSASQREEWVEKIKKMRGVAYETSYVYPNMIGKINISQAANLAATRAVARLLASSKYPAASIKVILDGGLYLKFLHNTDYPLLTARTVVRGDEKFNCIKLASIVAKVSRDRAMRRLHRKFPAYGLGEHKGYGTKAHIAAIKKYGPRPIHRRAFLRGILV